MNQTFVAEKCQVFALPWHKFKVSDIIRTPVHNIVTCSLSLVLRPFLYGWGKKGGEGSGESPGGSITPFLPAVLMREKIKCQEGVSHE